MTTRRKVFLGSALALFLATPFLFYQYLDLLDTAKDPVKCDAARDDYIKYTRNKNRLYVGHLGYCEELETEAWECRYGAIAAVVLGIAALYMAFMPSKKQEEN